LPWSETRDSIIGQPAEPTCGSSREAGAPNHRRKEATVDFSLTDEQRAVQEAARDFALGEVDPIVDDHDEAQRFPMDVMKKAGELKIITASLTRAQANAVRRRIDSLNEAIRQRNTSDQTNSPTSSHKSSKSSRSKQRRHVKDIFQNSDVVMNATSQTSKRM